MKRFNCFSQSKVISAVYAKLHAVCDAFNQTLVNKHGHYMRS